MALYAPKLPIPQITTMLEEGVRRYSVTPLPLGTLVEEYLGYQNMLFEREAVRKAHLNTVRASHHLVEYGNPHKTAAEMGHVGPATTFSTYRAAVKKSQAAIYWTVRANPEEPEPLDGLMVRWKKAA